MATRGSGGGGRGARGARGGRDGPSGSTGIFGDAALRFGTESSYSDPAAYDRAYRQRKDDVSFYVALAAAHGGPVLELGAGSGRVALALALAGHDVVALERYAPMRARLRERLQKVPADVCGRVEIIAGDLKTAKLDRRFALVIAPFNVLSHLYTRGAWESALRNIRGHLSSKGRFALDVPMPDIGSFLRNPLTTYRCRPLVDAETGDVLETHESFTYDAATQIQMITSLYGVVGKPERSFTRALAHRHIFPRELEAVLHYNGFDVETHDGNFIGGRLTLDSESQVVVARLARPARPAPAAARLRRHD